MRKPQMDTHGHRFTEANGGNEERKERPLTQRPRRQAERGAERSKDKKLENNQLNKEKTRDGHGLYTSNRETRLKESTKVLSRLDMRQ